MRTSQAPLVVGKSEVWLARCVSFGVAFSCGSLLSLILLVNSQFGLHSITLFLRSIIALPFAIPFLFPRPKRKIISVSYGAVSTAGDEPLSSAKELAEFRKNHWATVRGGVLRGVLWAAGLGCVCAALATETPNKVSLWSCLYVVMMPIAEGCIYGNITLRLWLAAAVSFSGLLVFEWSAEMFSNIFTIGTLMAFLTAVFYTIYYILAARAMTGNPERALPAAAGTLIGVALGAWVWLGIELLIITCLSGLDDAVSEFGNAMAQLRSWKVALCALWMGMHVAFTTLGESWLVVRIRASEHTIILATEAIWAGVAAYVVNGVPFTSRFAFGSFLSLVGVIITQLGGICSISWCKSEQSCFGQV